MELFAFLEPLRRAGFAVDFVPRVQEVEGSYEKEETLVALEPFHRRAVAGLGFHWEEFWRAEQVHGAEIGQLEDQGGGQIVSGVDGLMTDRTDALLGIYVADCGLIWVVDQRKGAMALLHSGRKGTEGEILPRAIRKMEDAYGSNAADLLVVLGPCIRPPFYEVDIADQIARQAEAAGVGEFLDCGICTAAGVADYYSYRLEKGCTGRMLGLLGRRRPEGP